MSNHTTREIDRAPETVHELFASREVPALRNTDRRTAAGKRRIVGRRVRRLIVAAVAAAGLGASAAAVASPAASAHAAGAAYGSACWSYYYPTPVYNQNGAIINWNSQYVPASNRAVISQVVIGASFYDLATYSTDQNGCISGVPLISGYSWRLIAAVPYKGWRATSWSYVGNGSSNVNWGTVFAT